MIRREQLVAAIRRIDAPERELLWLSLRRRVPDQSLAQLYGCQPGQVAERRAAAIEHVADELEVQRGEDFGAVLTGLLEPETWRELAPEQTLPAPSGQAGAEEPAPAAAGSAPDSESGPANPPGDPRNRSISTRPLRWALAATLATALIAVVVVAVAGGDDGGSRRGATFAPRPERPAGRASGGGGVPCYFTASVGPRAELYRGPGGRPLARLGARTRWGSPRVLHVVVRRAAWLEVIAPELRNGELGWLPVRAATVGCVRWSLEADLSRGRLEVRRGGRLVRTVAVAVGARRRQPPAGRFAVTDRLAVSGRSPYGCCLLVLSGHGTAGAGGARLTVFARSGEHASGGPLSKGALGAAPADARWLIDNVPLGTPIFIRS
ncbi:MAG: L,D-transpeptidase [Thermoleophilaceae bacterium]